MNEKVTFLRPLFFSRLRLGPKIPLCWRGSREIRLVCLICVCCVLKFHERVMMPGVYALCS